MFKKNSIRFKAESIMKSDKASGFLQYPMYTLSLLYSALIGLRTFAYDKGLFKQHQLPCKVISVGNITVGGTGKTPMTIFLANLINQMGYDVVVISRGYNSKISDQYAVVSDRSDILLTPDIAGDEPYLMALKLKGIPVLIGKNRYSVGTFAVDNFHPDVVILDDAFQHRALKRDLDIVLLDGQKPFGNSFLLPRGTLREPSRNLKRAKIIVMTRSNQNNIENLESLENQNDTLNQSPIFHCNHVPDNLSMLDKKGKIKNIELDELKKHRVMAVSGIARNDEFIKLLIEQDIKPVDTIQFFDHHDYTDADFDKIIKNAMEKNATCIVTTEKDFVKMIKKTDWPIEVYALKIRMAFWEKDETFKNIIGGYLL